MRIEISNRQRLQRVDPARIRNFARRILRNVRRLERTAPWTGVSVVLTDDRGITGLNAEYFGRHRPTDVISFTYGSVPGEPDRTFGEVVVNVERALAEGPLHAGANRELALYIAHGCHHLSGASDDTPRLRNRMRRREENWLREAEEQGCLAGLLVGNGNNRSCPNW